VPHNDYIDSGTWEHRYVAYAFEQYFDDSGNVDFRQRFARFMTKWHVFEKG
jgi:hypothetical protein